MSIIKKSFRRLVEGGEAVETDQYLDLGEMGFEDDINSAQHHVKVAEIYRYEDIHDLTTHVYNGDILILDYTALANDELSMRRVTGDLKIAAKDCGGDVAGIGHNTLVVTPSGIAVDRSRIKGSGQL